MQCGQSDSGFSAALIGPAADHFAPLRTIHAILGLNWQTDIAHSGVLDMYLETRACAPMVLCLTGGTLGARAESLVAFSSNFVSPFLIID